MAVAVEGQGQALAARRVAVDLEVPGAVLFVAVGGRGDQPGGVVDGGQQGEPQSRPSSQWLHRAVDLEEHAGLGHALPAAARPAGCILRGFEAAPGI